MPQQSKPLTTLAALQQAVQNLPPVAPGRIRVFRGQTCDYPKFLPSGLRGDLRRAAIWRAYSQHLHTRLLPDVVGPDGEVKLEFLMASRLWLQALAQHYGPGSTFLDVTHSLEVALWFALNDYVQEVTHGMIGPPGPVNDQTDHPTLGSIATYEAFDGVGSLYAFDLLPWDGLSALEPGILVDLAKAPEPFANCARMRAQSGCVVDCRQSGGELFDLRSLLVPGTPIPVSRPMADSAGLKYRTPQIFPGPEEDGWFSHLLCVPMEYAPGPDGPSLQRGLPVVPYWDSEDRAYTDSVVHRDVALKLPLVHHIVADLLARSKAAVVPLASDKPLAIVLESPFLFPYPPGDDAEAWHHGLLVDDQPVFSDVWSFGKEEPQGQVPLHDVMVQFSALEHTDWREVVEIGHQFKALRAVWLRRGGPVAQVAFIHQDLPNGPVSFQDFQPLWFDLEAAHWMFLGPDQEQIPIDVDPVAAKGLLVTLMLLRHLSPVLKVNATTSLVAGDPEGKREIMVRCARNAARLYRVDSPAGGWFVLRDAAKPQEPFTHLHEGNSEGMLKLQSMVGFGLLDTQAVKAYLRRP